MTQWSLDLCRGWQRIGEVTDFQFDGVERWLAPGEWALTCRRDAAEFQPGYGRTDVDTVRLVADRTIAFAGHVAPVSNGQGGRVERVDEGATTEWTGVDLWAPITARLAFPDPAAQGPWQRSHDRRSGPASTVLASYLRHNLGDLAIQNRRIPSTVIDRNVGLNGAWSARLQPLHELAARICRDGGITCRPTIDFDGQLTITVEAQRDLSSTVRVTDLDDLVSLESRQAAQGATFAVAGGQGELTARAFATIDTGATGIDRREAFIDHSNLETLDELNAAASTAVAEPDVSIRYEPGGEDIDLINHVHVGDRVGVQIDGHLTTVPVVAATFTVSAERAQVRPVLGGASWNELTGLLTAVDELTESVGANVA